MNTCNRLVFLARKLDIRVLRVEVVLNGLLVQMWLQQRKLCTDTLILYTVKKVFPLLKPLIKCDEVLTSVLTPHKMDVKCWV